ncbi:transposase [Embleya scabrispora]|uniref:transposase n=1 Tax=Embleya scabrispora TaxID=159449 RepID=UPI0013750548|nr:transposase [Embleya scabrispora]
MTAGGDEKALRGPVSDEEAIRLYRRKRLESSDADMSEDLLPTTMADLAGGRVSKIFRLPEDVVARAEARAAREGLALTPVVEEMFRRYAKGTPRDPEAALREISNAGVRLSASQITGGDRNRSSVTGSSGRSRAPRLTKAQWARVRPHVPDTQGRSSNAREVLDVIAWRYTADLRWALAPADLGISGQAAYQRLRRWKQTGTWQEIVAALRDGARPGENLAWLDVADRRNRR